MICHQESWRSTKNYFLLITREALGDPLQLQLTFYSPELVKLKKYFAVPMRHAERQKKGMEKVFQCLWELFIPGTFANLSFLSSGDQEISAFDKAASLAATINCEDLKLSRDVSSGNCGVIKPCLHFSRWEYQTLVLTHKENCKVGDSFRCTLSPGRDLLRYSN